MHITFKIANFQDVKAEYGHAEMHKTFSELGGLIGRSSQCTWILSDDTRKISSKHAIIEFQYGDFYITDASTNGTKLNGLKIEKNLPMKLKEGDIIELSLYKIIVANILKDKVNNDLSHIINTEQAAKTSTSDNLSFLDETKLSDNIGLPFEYADSKNVHALRDSFSQLEMSNEYSLENLSSVKKQPQLESFLNSDQDKNYNEFIAIEEGEDSAHILQIDDDFDFVNKVNEPEPPLPRHSNEKITSEHNITSEHLVKKEYVENNEIPNIQQYKQPSKPQQQPEEVSGDDYFLRVFCQKTGVSYEVIKQLNKNKIYSDIADILTYSMDGVIRLMMERNNAKNKLDSDLTMFTSQVKNPLKMSMSSKQALETILFDTTDSVMPARQAVGESVSEIVSHFKKVEDSTRGVISMFVDSFDPENIEKDIMQTGRVLPGMLASKCWAKHKTKYAQMFGTTKKQKEKNIKEYISDKYNG